MSHNSTGLLNGLDSENLKAKGVLSTSRTLFENLEACDIATASFKTLTRFPKTHRPRHVFKDILARIGPDEVRELQANLERVRPAFRYTAWDEDHYGDDAVPLIAFELWLRKGWMNRNYK